MGRTEVSAVLPECLLMGLDSLYVAFPYHARQSKIDWDDLAYRKELAKAGGKSEGEQIQLGCERFMLQPYGSKPYSYVLRNRDFIVRLAENLNPCCHVQFLSEGLWGNGAQEQFRRFELWASSVGFSRTSDPVVSRADWAFDFAVSAIDFDENHFISLASKDSKHRKDGRAQTFTFGTGDKVVRVYDKCAEIEEESGKTWFYQLWGQISDVWRVEFQVRGEGLREFGIKSPADLFTRQAGMLRVLARKHTTLRSPSTDRNRSRWPLHPLWSALLQAIDALPHQVRGEPINPRLPDLIRMYEQEKSLYGHLKSFGALWSILDGREQPYTLKETLNLLSTGLSLRQHNPADWEADLQHRRQLHQLGEW